jgi:hypothetical protein
LYYTKIDFSLPVFDNSSTTSKIISSTPNTLYCKSDGRNNAAIAEISLFSNFHFFAIRSITEIRFGSGLASSIFCGNVRGATINGLPSINCGKRFSIKVEGEI